MVSALLFGVAVLGPYNYTGRLADFLPEGAAWGMPSTGLPMQITITKNGSAAGPDSFSVKGPKWSSSATVELKGLTISGGVLSGNVHFKNTSGFALDAVRFDVVSATERYKGKDGETTRPLAVAEDSPILLGDMPKDSEFGGADFKATGLAWKPETTEITVTAKLSGLTYQRVLFDEHANSNLDFDAKGRLLLGSGQKPGIYRADVDRQTLDMVTSTPEYKVQVAVNPVTNSIAATWMNGHTFNLYTPGGDETKVIQESEAEGMNGWPQMARYDGKGNLYLGFGQTVAQMAGDKPAFVLKNVGQFEFGGYVMFDVTREGALYIGADKKIFKFDAGGKNGRLFIKGPDEKLGRVHDFTTIRVDHSGYIWVAEPTDGEFANRISVFDPNGKFVWVFGRGGEAAPVEGFLDGQLVSSTSSIAVSDDGRVYVAGYEQAKSVVEFYTF